MTETINNFDDMNLKESVLRGIYNYGFEKPSLIQSKGIPLIIKGGDVIAQSQSGTGKTGTFVISALHLINYELDECQGIILVPTRELAIQVVNVCTQFSSFTPVKSVLCVGGTSVDENKRHLETKGPKIIIGTPGRILDMIERRVLPLKFIKILIMDEADEMLTGFEQNIKNIFMSLPKETQICLFSATLPTTIFDITERFMTNPTNILIEPEEVTLDGIRQFYINAGDEEGKYLVLKELYGIININQTIIYVNKKRLAEELQCKLEKDNFSAAVINSDLSPNERSYIMKEFRDGRSKILISTDLLARGIDIQQVSIIINYELPLPNNIDNYVHRIGRSGRFGRKGTAINIVTRNEFYRLEEITKYFSTRINPFPEDYSDF